jgi:hypothetical protein
MKRTRSRDDGFTLIELVIVIVLTLMIGGVIVAGLITSLNVASATTDQIGDSTDAALVSSFLLRDAQSAGATDPTTAARDSTLGVSIDPLDAGWSDCTPPSTYVLRFGWIDRAVPVSITQPGTRVVVYYTFDSSTAQLTRRACRDASSADLVIGHRIFSAVAACDTACSGNPSYVRLTLKGSGTRAPFTYTLKASLRGVDQALPTSTNSLSVPLLTLGPTASCPNVDLSGKTAGVLTVVGNVLVDGSCGAAPIKDNQSLLHATGTVSSGSQIVDPFRGRQPPSFTCDPLGTNPAAMGQSAARDDIVVYPQAVNVVTNTVFQPGRYVFCNGLEFTSGQITGSDVLLYVAAATVNIETGAIIDLTGRLSGPDTGLLIWVAAPGQTVGIAGGTHASSLRGAVYAPTSHMHLSSAVGANIGGLIGKDLTIIGQGTGRIGALPSIIVTPATLPMGTVGQAYSATLVASGGAGPYTWSASGLPAGLSIGASTGVISGTPVAPGPPVVVVTVFDATAAAASFDYLLSVDAGLGIFRGHQDVGSTVGLGASSYSDPTYTLSVGMGDIGGSSDTFQFMYLPMTGNGRLTARVASQTDTDASAQAGVMFRETLDATSSYAMMDVTKSNGGQFVYRDGAGSAAIVSANGTPPGPYWVRLTRVGDLFTAERSADGVTWIGVEQRTITMASTLYVGLAVSTHNASGSLGTATFDNVGVVIPAPVAPALTTTAVSLAYTENGTTAIDPGLTATDLDNANLSSATVTITSGYLNGQDTLAFTNQNGITGTWTASTGVLALSGQATVANYQTAMRSVTYTNNSDNPSTALRTATFVVDDGALYSNSANRTITVTAVDDAPVVTATGTAMAYTENGTTVVDPGITVADVDSGNLSSATVTMTTAYVNGQDTLAFVNQNGIAGTWTAATGVLALSGNTTVANYQTALRSVTYNNNSDNPTTTTRTAAFVVNDGVINSLLVSRTITLTAVDDAPTVTATGTAMAYTESGTTAVDPGITVTDVDSANLSSATMTMTTAYVNGQDTLGFVSQNGITGVWTPSTGVLILSGTSTVANYQVALRSVTYFNNSQSPSTSTRTVTLVVNDGSLDSNTTSRTIAVTAVNDAPVNTVPAAQVTAKNTAKVFSSANGNLISIGDLDAGSNSVQVQLVSANGTTTLAGFGGLTFGVGDGTADATMTFSGTVANVNVALSGLSFSPTNNFIGAASLQIVTNDLGNTGTGGAGSDTDTITITVANAPVVTTTLATLAYTENGTTVLDSGITVTDVDSANLSSATVIMTTNYVNGQDTLAFVNQNGITGTWTASTGVLTLSGSATKAFYQTALRSITYNNNSDSPTTATRTVTFKVNDGALDSNTATRTITITAVNDVPVATPTGSSMAYTENGTTVLDSGITVTDADSATMSSATVTMTTNYVNGQDTLAFLNQNGITGTWTASSGVLALSGSSTVANYQTALRSITYNNSSDNPTTTVRTVSFVVNDGTSNSSPVTRTVTLTAVNDAPVNSVPGSQTTAKNVARVFSAANSNLISISDVDAGSSIVQVQLTSINGKTTLSRITGLTFLGGTGNGQAAMTFTGTIANINAALAGLSFAPTNAFTGAASLQIATSDQGFTGTGGALTDTDTIAITVT